MTYKVTVIVPVYNVEKYLTECINSILNQSHRNLEIILVNDGSTDNSLKICNDFKRTDSRIKVIDKKNEGVSATRNRGIEASTGEYICFVDADDYIMADYVEYLLKLAVDNDADVSMTKNMMTTFYPKCDKKEMVEIYTPEKATIEILIYNVPIGVYCKMFKRKFLGTEIRFIPEIFIGEGFNFNTEAFQKANKVVAGRKAIYFYRRDNEASAMTRFRIEKIQNGLYAIENIKNNLIINSKPVIRAWNYANWHTHCDMYNFMELASVGATYPEIYRRCLKISRTKFYYSFFFPIRPREKVRSLIILISPKIITWLLKKRMNTSSV